MTYLDRIAACNRHDLSRYVDLGRRLRALEELERSERALTTAVELSAHESEGHRLVAGVREEQERWEDAAEHWRHVTRIRTKEPEAYVRLARVLIRLDRLDEAREVAHHLRATSWPSRFGNVHHTADQLLREIDTRG